MTARTFIVIAVGSAVLVSVTARALPGGQIGMNCDHFIKGEVASGAKITRKDASSDGFVVRLESRFDGRRMEAMYTCAKGSITRKFAVIYMPTEVDSIDLFHRLRDEAESALGAPFFDGTKPEQLDPFAEFFDSDSESLKQEYRFYALWIAKGVQQSLGVSHNRERWVVTISSSADPDA